VYFKFGKTKIIYNLLDHIIRSTYVYQYNYQVLARVEIMTLSELGRKTQNAK
jgi:hypothetical protein